MKYYTFILSFCLILSTPVFSFEDGKMLCQIKGQKIMDMVDGKYQEFDRFKGDLSIGDTFYINYYYSEDGGGQFDINLKGGEDYMSAFSSRFNTIFAYKGSRSINRKYSYIDQLNPSSTRDNPHPKKFLHWRPDSITVGYIGQNILTLKRYYKSDWMGMLTTQTSLKNQPVTNHHVSFDCRHETQDKLEDFFYSALELLDP